MENIDNATKQINSFNDAVSELLKNTDRPTFQGTANNIKVTKEMLQDVEPYKKLVTTVFKVDEEW